MGQTILLNVLFLLSFVLHLDGFLITSSNLPAKQHLADLHVLNHPRGSMKLLFSYHRRSLLKSLRCTISPFQEGPQESSSFGSKRSIVHRFPHRIEGHCRVKVHLNVAEFDVRAKALRASSVMHFVNFFGSNLIERGLRVNFIFNSIADVADARRLIRKDLEDKVQLNVLGLGSFGHDSDIAVLVCPNNEGNENLRRIEAVERLLYAGPPSSVVSRRSREAYMQRPIIMINPSLEAIHPHSSHHRKVVPMFMSDFETAYYLDPHLIRLHEAKCDRSHAGLLKMFPSPHWQLWVRSHGSGDEFKLVWQRSERPSDADLTPYLSMALEEGNHAPSPRRLRP